MATFPAFSSNIVYSGKSPEPTFIQRNKTDVVHVVVRLYIEGVEVPYTAISVSQSYQQLPVANIEVPPASGLLDIIRGYQPKVHIFYEDQVNGDLRLLFWGHITASGYSRSRRQGAGANITFSCVHKNAHVFSFTLDFVSWANRQAEQMNDPVANSAGGGVAMNSMNSTYAIIDALSGVEGIADQSERFVPENATTLDKLLNLPVNKIDPALEKIARRLYGMPGIAINMWNQVKRDGLNSDIKNLAMLNMWTPLTEEALSYFKRMSGHPILEELLQATKEAYCHQGTSKETEILVAPCFRHPTTSAVQREMSAKAVQNALSFSHELTSYPDLIRSVFEISQYDMITLASPAEVPADPLVYTQTPWAGETDLMAVETIIKPKMPFYFSPICNVLFPKMYSGIQLSQDEASVPTRVTAHYDSIPGVQGLGVNYRGPHSVREAVAYNAKLKSPGHSAVLSLTSTTDYSYSIPGKYEIGSGIRPLRIAIPWWLTQIIGEKNSAAGSTEEVPTKGTKEYDEMMLLARDWEIRYGQNVKMEDGSITRVLDPAKVGLNIYSPATQGLKPHEKLLFATVDQEYATKVASSRVANIDCLFNPYIVPGYPMDVIDDSPNHPSFHGFCTSVTHSISSRGISTSVSMASATTYAELSNYYIPPVSPYLQTALNIVNGTKDESAAKTGEAGDTSQYKDIASTLIQNPKAKATANDFYMQVLGVGAAAPDDLIHFSSGRAYAVERDQGTFVAKYAPGASGPPELKGVTLVEGRGILDYHTSMGNMKLVARPIETKTSIESKFSLKFINMDPVLYNGATINYLNPILASNLFLEPGASMFLDYMEVEDFISSR